MRLVRTLDLGGDALRVGCPPERTRDPRLREIPGSLRPGPRLEDHDGGNKPRDVSAGDIADKIRSGSMPPWFYTILHSNAKLSPAEKDALVNGLNATLAKSPPLGGGG